MERRRLTIDEARIGKALVLSWLEEGEASPIIATRQLKLWLVEQGWDESAAYYRARVWVRSLMKEREGQRTRV